MEAGQLIVMRELAELLFGRLAAGDVLVGERDVSHGAVRIVHGSGGEPDVEQGAVLAPALHVEVPDGLAAADAAKQRLGLRLGFGRHQHSLPAEHFIGPVAEHLLGAATPQHDGLIEIATDYRHM
jgi:hypothetical protein